MTAIVQLDTRRALMVLGRPILRFRAIAVLLLFAAALLTNSVDAVACEPEIEAAQLSLVMASEADHSPSQGHSERGGDACVHGHCHSGSQALAVSEPLPNSEQMRFTYASAEPPSLGSPVNRTPEHPPRA